ncbi:MAG: ABC transporter permease [Firmicutes bacterium]|nr:ABC transporter permease [Bacillota bacterium]
MRLLFIYLKTLLRSRTLIFWTLIFPLVLSVLFHFAFSNLLDSESFHPVAAGVVDHERLQDEGFSSLLDQLSRKTKDNDQVLELHCFESEKEAEAALAEGKITGVYVLTEDEEHPVELLVNGSGIEQTILKEVADEYFRGASVVGSLYERAASRPEGAAALAAGEEPRLAETGKTPAELYAETAASGSHFKDISSDRTDFTIIYFYTLLGMLCMYGATFGIHAATETEANLSKRAARVSASPVRKPAVLSAVTLAGFLVLFIETVIVVFFMDRILGVAFGDQVLYILLLCAAGCFAGVSFGVFIGSSSQKSAEFKDGLSIGLTMALCFLGGMMYQDMRYIIKDHLPVLDLINPITMITDGLYSLYCYSDHDLLWNAFLRLAVFGFIFLGAALFCMRKKKYDSL